MVTYTFIPKPTGSQYTNVNTVGKQQYDQSDLMYDDPLVFYDGIDTLAYTNVPKPAFQNMILSAGFANGLMIPLTRSSVIGITQIDPYIRIAKPI